MRNFLVGLCALVTLSAPVQAASVLDQSNIAPGSDPSFQIIASGLSFATDQGVLTDLAGLQFVTAGMSGKLTQVDLQLAKHRNGQDVPISVGSGSLIIAKDIIFNGTEIVSGTLLAEVGFPTSGINGFSTLATFDLSSFNIHFDSGNQFVIAVLGNEDVLSLFRWAFSGDAYAGGKGYFGVAFQGNDELAWLDANQQGPLNRDYGFQTWMAVPEPATWAMMILGFGLVGGAMRRRRVTAAINFA